MKEQTLVSMAIAASMVFIICLVLLGSVSVAALVFLMVALTDLAILAGCVTAHSLTLSLTMFSPLLSVSRM
jgi:hypothetical protein